jgi:hypothetical protein
MRFTPLVPPITGLVASDLSASRFCAVTGPKSAMTLPSAGGRILGVLFSGEGDAAGKAVPVIVFGPAPGKGGGSFSDGDPLKVTAAGKFVSASADDIAAGSMVALALEDGALDRVSEVLLLPAGSGTSDVSAVQSLAAPGEVNADSEITELSVDGTDAFTMEDGRYVGQRKIVRCIAADNTPVGTLTPDDMAVGQPASFIFSAVGQELTFEWTAAGWKVVDGKTAGVDTPAQGATPLRQLVMNHVVSIDGTDDWILDDGLWPGQTKNVIVAAAANTPAGTVSGKFYDNADGSADGTDLTINAAADAAMLIWDGLRWFPVGLVSATT